MARVKGGYLSGTYDTPKKQPLDSRMLVTKRVDLINPSVWKTNGSTTGETGYYNGMIVAVSSDGIYNGVYYLADRTALTDENYTAYKNALASGEDVESYFSMWTKLGTLEDLETIEKKLAEKYVSNEAYSEFVDKLGLQNATSGQIPYMGTDGKVIWSNIAIRRDNDYNYKKIENTFIPINGEVCLVDVAGYGLRSKVGDGIHTFAQLPYADEIMLQNINSLIVKGYFYQNNFYVDASHTELLENVIGRIYVDIVSSKLYTYNGVNYETQTGSLPKATAETAGAVKLYDQIGQNVDGTMTQRAITNELNEKFEMDVVEEEEMVVFDVDID